MQWVALGSTDFRHPLAHLRQPLAHLWNNLRQPFAHLWSDLGHGIDFLSFLTPQMSQNHAKNNQNRLHNLPRKDFEIYISKKWETSLKIIPKTIRKINVGICTIHQKLKFSKNVECVKNLGFYCVARISPKFSRYIRRSATRGKNVPKSCSKRGRHLQWKT